MSLGDGQDIDFAPATAAASCAEPDSSAEKLREPRVILAGPEPLVESLTWHDATAGKPDADGNVLLWLGASEGCDAGWSEGWWDGDDWRLAESGGIADAEVLCWAEPVGPVA